MNIIDCKKQFEKISQRTLCFLIKDGKVLLGYKKTGFGRGNYIGIGGKVEPGETVIQAMEREMREEVGVNPINTENAATVNFDFPYVENPEKWNQSGRVFIANQWDGEITESDEIRPQWFAVNELSLSQMWDDASYWLPQILRGEKLIANFLFDSDLKVAEHQIVGNG